MDSNTLEYQKRRKRKDTFKKVLINVVVWGIIITFVATIGVTWSQSANREFSKIVSINGKLYEQRPDSAFQYILEDSRMELSSRFGNQINPEFLARLSLQRGIQQTMDMGLIYDFAERNDAMPSKEIIQLKLERIYGGRNYTPNQGMIEYMQMSTAQQNITGPQGDLLNGLGLVTVAELYSYFDLVNYTVEAEVLYINTTNFILSQIKPEQTRDYYTQNASRYLKSLNVDDVSFEDKTEAFQALETVKTEGWDSLLKKYQGKYKLENNLVLRDSKGFNKRYQMATTMLPGEITTNTKYENGVYHIFKINSYPAFETLSPATVQDITADYVATNFQSMQQQYTPLLKKATEDAARMAQVGNRFDAIAQMTGLSYAKSGRISPVNQVLRDKDGNTVPLPLMTTSEWMDFLFSAEKGQVSKVFENNGYVVILKVLDKGLNPNIDYDKIDQEIFMRYIRFKNYASDSDWYANLRDQAKIVYFTNDIMKLSEN